MKVPNLIASIRPSRLGQWCESRAHYHITTEPISSNLIENYQGDDLMSSLDKAVQTQLDNIQKKTGLSLEELSDLGQEKAGYPNTLRSVICFMEKLGLGYGDANALVHAILKSDGARFRPKAKAPRPFWMKFIQGSKSRLPPHSPKVDGRDQ